MPANQTENQNIIRYYPDDFLGHAFLKTLAENNAPLYERAYEFFSNIRKNLLTSTGRPANLSSLEALANYEQEKEANFLQEIAPELHLNSSPKKKIGEYIKAFNFLLGREEIFYRNVQRVKAITKSKRNGQIDITSIFGTYLNIIIKDQPPEWFTPENLYEATRQALIKMFSATDKINGEEIQAYKDLGEAIGSLEHEPYVKEIFDLYFGPDLFNEFQSKQILEDYRNATASTATVDKIKKSIGFQQYKGTKKGNLLEAVERLSAEIGDNFVKSVYASGELKMKTDNFLMSVGVDVKQLEQVFEEQLERQASVRLKSIERMERLHQALANNKGQIVEVTDKNYNLTSQSFADNKGFTAESDISATYFSAILDKMLVPSRKNQELMFVLANTHPLLLSNDEDFSNAEKVLGAYIGYFLFDDLQIPEFKEGTNFIHVMNLDGIYIPLSVFLFAACRAFKQTSKPEKALGYVNVHIHQTFNGWQNDDDKLNAADWNAFYNQRLEEVKITTHFFGNFVDFIKENIKL